MRGEVWYAATMRGVSPSSSDASTHAPRASICLTTPSCACLGLRAWAEGGGQREAKGGGGGGGGGGRGRRRRRPRQRRWRQVWGWRLPLCAPGWPRRAARRQAPSPRRPSSRGPRSAARQG
eukprot:scaffold134_cov61-Phaeocystis_antarctica.AAC.8